MANTWTSGTSITSSDGRIWECWTADIATVTSSATTTAGYWSTWTTGTTNSITVTAGTNSIWSSWSVAREDRHEARKRQIKARRKQSEIDERAERLLLSLLNEEEQRDFKRYGSLRIVGKKNVYEIGQRHDLVTVMDKKGVPQHNLCLHASLHYPKLDRLAATLLALRFDEEAVIKRGNFNSLRTREADHIMARRGHMVA